MRTLTRKIPTVLLCLTVLLSLLSAAALAVEPIDPDSRTALTIEYRHNSTFVSGADFNVYLVAERTEYATFDPVDPFRSYNLPDTKKLDVQGWNELAVTLKGYARRDQIEPVASGKTDENGKLTVDDLKPGLYLVVGERRSIGSYTYSVDPFLVCLPGLDEATNEWNYDVTAVPKSTSYYDYSDDLPTPVTVERRVLKIWDDEGNEELRPDEISVDLLRDGQVYDTVTLNAANNWRFTWKDLDMKYEWLVVEQTVDSYYSVVEQEGITFTITNTCLTEIEDDPVALAAPDPVPLPQTGVLWWPVPVMALAGIVFLTIGVVLNKKVNDEE